MYETTGMGYRIGNIRVNSTSCADDIARVNSTACADDIALISEEQDQAQILINMAYDYAYMEGYELQPTKSVVLNITHKQSKQEHNNSTFTLGPNKMTSVESATWFHGVSPKVH